MKALMTSRSEIRWAALAVPAIVLAHWMVTTLGQQLLRLAPDSVRTVLHLL
jgi:hypothetical protein